MIRCIRLTASLWIQSLVSGEPIFDARYRCPSLHLFNARFAIDLASTYGINSKTLLLCTVLENPISLCSFRPPSRAPFTEILSILAATRLPIVSVDVPSGWDVEAGTVVTFQTTA